MGLTKSRFRAQLSTGILENDAKLISATVEEMRSSNYPVDMTVTPDGHTVFSLAIEGVYSGKVKVETFKLLIKLGFDLNKEMESPLAFTPIYAAVRRNQLELLRMLLDAGADATRGESSSEDSLFTACGMGYADCVELLLKFGANPNSISPGPGGTPMMLAVQTSHVNAPRILTLLIEHGADLTCLNRVQRNVLHAAADCLADVTDCSKILLDAGVDVNKRDQFGQTPLHMAVIANRPKVIHLFLEYGADPNVKSNEGETPLDIAYRMEHPDVIKILKPLTVTEGPPETSENNAESAGAEGTQGTTATDDAAILPHAEVKNADEDNDVKLIDM